MSLTFGDEGYQMSETNQDKTTNSATFWKFSLPVKCTEFSRSFSFCFFPTITCSPFSCPINHWCSGRFLKNVASEWFINFVHWQYHWLQNFASIPSQLICGFLYFKIFHFSTCLSKKEILFYNGQKAYFNPFLLCLFTHTIPDSQS